MADILDTTPLATEPLDISLDELLNKDPLDLTQEEKKATLQAYRAAWDRWAEEEASSKITGRRQNLKKGMKKGSSRVKSKIDISSLDLEI